MDNAYKCELIGKVLNSTLSDADKVYYIQSFLLNWISAEKLIEVVNANQN